MAQNTMLGGTGGTTVANVNSKRLPSLVQFFEPGHVSFTHAWYGNSLQNSLSWVILPSALPREGLFCSYNDAMNQFGLLSSLHGKLPGLQWEHPVFHSLLARIRTHADPHVPHLYLGCRLCLSWYRF